MHKQRDSLHHRNMYDETMLHQKKNETTAFFCADCLLKTWQIFARVLETGTAKKTNCVNLTKTYAC